MLQEGEAAARYEEYEDQQHVAEAAEVRRLQLLEDEVREARHHVTDIEDNHNQMFGEGYSHHAGLSRKSWRVRKFEKSSHKILKLGKILKSGKVLS